MNKILVVDARKNDEVLEVLANNNISGELIAINDDFTELRLEDKSITKKVIEMLKWEQIYATSSFRRNVIA